jgi:SpoVK/Ycf46/Vps4 family AAA+-type ATPase
MMARAAAGELGAALFARKASDLIRSLYGQTEKLIQKLFAEARKCKRAIIYIDEIETLIPERGNLRNNFEKTVVTQFLTELEGFEGGGGNALLFMGTSNNPWDIDAAMMRPGRFDVRIYMGLPDLPARRHMLEMQFAKLPVSPEVDWSRWAVRMDGFSGADIRAFAERAGREALKAEMASGRPTPCGDAILERCLETVRPSVTPEHLTKYARWREKNG